MVSVMSELQAALLAIGLGVIVAVYFYGWWQQRKYRKKFGATFKGSHADALYQAPLADPVEHVIDVEQVMDVERVMNVEPLIDAEPEIAVEPVEEAPQALIPEVAPLPDRPCAFLDANSDFIIELKPIEPSPAAVLGGLWQRKFDFGKPVHLYGLKLNTQLWERAIADSQSLYTSFQIALQLVDRNGAVSAAKLADFKDLVQGVAKQIKAGISFPDILETHKRATLLDTFCAEVDQMVGINLLPPGERLLSGATIAQAATLHGLKLETDGAFHLKDARGLSLYTLINRDAMPFQHHTLQTFSTKGLTLLLDVPRVEHPAAQFDRMVSAARELARELQVNMVDDHRVALSDQGLALIHEQIEAVETKMSEQGITPGNELARRLFA
jgi:FtsZ-interacting cell division protein ZipA